MPDYFALLDQPRRPWLDLEALQSRFLALAAEAHPDRFHNSSPAEREAAHQRSSQLNAAYQCLRDVKQRLRHLLELEMGAKLRDVQQIPPDAMDLFMEVAQLCRSVDGFLAERAKITSPLLKVGMFEQGAAWAEKLAALRTRIERRIEELVAALTELNTAWEQAPSTGSPERPAALPLDRLESIYCHCSYLTRWSGQIQERFMELAA